MHSWFDNKLRTFVENVKIIDGSSVTFAYIIIKIMHVSAVKLCLANNVYISYICALHY